MFQPRKIRSNNWEVGKLQIKLNKQVKYSKNNERFLVLL